MTVTVTIRTRMQLTPTQRRRRDSEWDKWRFTRGMARAKPDHKRTWSNSSKDRHNGGYHFFGPGWLLPSAIPNALSTISASIIWGIYGALADVRDEQKETFCGMVSAYGKAK